MRSSLETALFARYPLFFVQLRPSSDPSMGPGIACGDGWEPLIRRVAAAADQIRLRRGVICVAAQIKEKLGSLRVHYRVCGDLLRDEQFDRIVAAAGNLSLRLCEVCGASGHLAIARGRVYRTLCEDHLSRRAVADYEAAHDEAKRFDPAHDFRHLPPGSQPGDVVPGCTLPPIWPITKEPSPAGDEKGNP